MLPSVVFETPQRPFAKNWPLHLIIAGLLLIWILLFIRPVDWMDWLLENALPVIFIVTIALLYRKFTFNNVSYLLMVIYLALHLTGAHYAYESAPIDFWYRQTFHTQHGVSDRIVHFAFGCLLAYPIQELLVRTLKLGSLGSYITTFAIIMACSAIFEIMEMVVGQIANPQLAEKYLGLQGDPLDSQKDMVMALIGVLLALGWLLFFRYNRYKKHRHE